LKIVFKNIAYQNFRSVGSTPIKIDLNKHKTTLVSGGNGTGKTTLMSALCYVLFGRGYGSINKPALINSINQKKMLVTVTFDIGKKSYKIIRGMKPNVFEIYEDEKLINQDPNIKDYQKVLEQQILKFNYRAFTQVVMVGGGSDYTPFMKLSAKDRREFIEDLLDIRVFSTMNVLVKEQAKTLKDDLKFIEISMKSIKEKIVLQESFIKKLKKEKSDSSDKVLASISELQDKDKEFTTEIKKLMEELSLYEKKVDEHDALDDTLTEVRMSHKQLKASITKKKEKQAFYEELTVCPTCSQSISDGHKHDIIKGFTSEIDSVSEEIERVVSQEEQLRQLIDSYQSALVLFDQTKDKISQLNKEQFSIKTSILNANKQFDELQNDTNSIEFEQEKQKKFAKEYMTSNEKKKSLLELQQYQDLVQQVLSDSGIKSKIIRQYIPTINKLINHYLGELDFFVSFHLDEQFNESIKSRHRDTFTYENFSEGQKRRIDLAILLTWVEIAKAKNALHCNVAFYDEIDAPLDSTGSDMLHSALKASSSENIFVVSHKGDLLADKVDNVISFRLHNNFTELTT